MTTLTLDYARTLSAPSTRGRWVLVALIGLSVVSRSLKGLLDSVIICSNTDPMCSHHTPAAAVASFIERTRLCLSDLPMLAISLLMAVLVVRRGSASPKHMRVLALIAVGAAAMNVVHPWMFWHGMCTIM
jgi:hypothetical protein